MSKRLEKVRTEITRLRALGSGLRPEDNRGFAELVQAASVCYLNGLVDDAGFAEMVARVRSGITAKVSSYARKSG